MTSFKLAFFCAIIQVVLWGSANSVRSTDLSASARIDTLVWRIQVTGNTALESFHRRTTVLSAAGRKFGGLVAGESPYVRLKSVQLLHYDSSGHLIQKVSKKDMMHQCGYGQQFELYNDNCLYYYTPAASTYPYTIVTDYEIECKSLFFVRGFKVPRDISIAFGQIELSYEQTNPVHCKLYDLDLPAEESHDEETEKVVWTIHDLPKVEQPNRTPAEHLEGSRIEMYPERFALDDYIMPARSWKNIGLFYKALSDSQYLPVIGQPSTARSHGETVALADSLYGELVRKTRYVAVSIGLSGWRPEPAAKTAARGYGDCKGLSTLLVSRLREAGIAAFPCLIQTSDVGAMDSGFVNDNFNHVITMALVDDDTLWNDATTNVYPPGELPPHDEGVYVLAVTDTGGVIVRTPVSSARKNEVFRLAEITVNDSGRTIADVSSRMAGHFASRTRGALEGRTREEVREYVKTFFTGGNATVMADSCLAQKLDSVAVPVELSARMSFAKPADRIRGVGYLFPFLLAARTPHEGLELETRTMPVDLGYPYSIIDSVILHSPWTMTADSVKMPADDSVSFPGGWTTVKFSRDSTSILGELRQVFAEQIVPVADLPKFSAYLSARKKLLDRPVKWFAAPAH